MERAAVIIFGAFCNWFIRGGGYKVIGEPFNIRSKISNALFFGLAAAISHKELSATAYPALMLIAMLIGQAPALFNPVTDKYVANKQYIKWFAVVALRGFIWFVPIVCVQAYYNGLQTLYFAFIALLMPVCYFGVWVKPFGNKWVNNWTLAEMLFGACIWSILII